VVTGFVGGSASAVFAHGGALVNSGSAGAAMYAYTDIVHVHAVTAVSGLGTFAYDKNGNMTQRVEGGTTYTQTFDVVNRLVSVAVGGGGTTQYQYDANGQMLKKIAPDGAVTVYLGLVEYEIGGGVTQTTSYYTVPGARVVRVDGTLSYVLTDHLSSSSVTLDSNGAVVGELRYYAYSETRISTGATPTERLYTGQLDQPDIGLYYYNARWYAPYLNRWIQPDTIVPDPLDPQNLNRFSYTLNNPIKYTDPSGHSVDCGIGEARCRAGRWVPKVRVYYLNQIGYGNDTGPIRPSSNPAAGEGYLVYQIERAAGSGSASHIPIFTGGLGETRVDMFEEMFDLNQDWSTHVVGAIESDIRNNPLEPGEELILVGNSGGGTVAIEA
jgi:RHS repeat-associated protein